MKLIWEIEDTDVKKVMEFYDKHKEKSFVLRRFKRNVKKGLHEFSKDLFWSAMVSCLLTTQQRSGPGSAVTRFISSEPFPLSYEICKQKQDLKYFVEATIVEFGGIRRAKRLAEEILYNFLWLEQGGWKVINEIA